MVIGNALYEGNVIDRKSEEEQDKTSGGDDQWVYTCYAECGRHSNTAGFLR
jgi:hypothetical protein